MLITVAIQQSYRDIQAVFQEDQKINIPEFKGEDNGVIFMDWLLRVNVLFDYKQLRDPKQVQVTKAKLRHWWMYLQTSKIDQSFLHSEVALPQDFRMHEVFTVKYL